MTSLLFDAWCLLTQSLFRRGYGPGYLEHMLGELHQQHRRDDLRL